MNTAKFRKAVLFCAVTLLGSAWSSSNLLAGAASPAVMKAKQEAEAKGYIFLASKDEIVANAKKEGNLRVLGSLDKAGLNALSEAFKKKYPFINARAEEINGMEVYVRMIQEMKAGVAKNWDVNYLAFDHYNDYLPYQKKFDLLGMAQQGVVQIPAKMIDPVNRHVIVVASDLQVVAYNKQLWPTEKIPSSWEGFLREEFKEKKFMLDIRPKDLAALVPAWGLEKTIDYARKLGAQNPVWVRGNSRAMPLVLSGERPILFGPNLGTVMEAVDKDPTKTLAYKIIEPVPTRLNEAQAILGASANPHAALLWLEFVVSAEGQAILDKHEPYGASLLTAGSVQEKLTKGLKLSVLDWDHYTKMGEYEKKIVEAYGFPRAGK
ncbi:MAG: ABC transporter substrate-binding protein [Candidatus Binatia bacterium]